MRRSSVSVAQIRRDCYEAFATGRAVCPSCCKTCKHYPDPYSESGFCPMLGIPVRRLHYCSHWAGITHTKGGDGE